MKLRGIDFGNFLGASGVQGFFGEGYWFHHPWKPFGLDLSRMTFVSKTATLFARKGNMTLTRRHTPVNPFPRCVRVRPFRGLMLNSVGLSNPGIERCSTPAAGKREKNHSSSPSCRSRTRPNDGWKNSASWWT